MHHLPEHINQDCYQRNLLIKDPGETISKSQFTGLLNVSCHALVLPKHAFKRSCLFASRFLFSSCFLLQTTINGVFFNRQISNQGNIFILRNITHLYKGDLFAD